MVSQTWGCARAPPCGCERAPNSKPIFSTLTESMSSAAAGSGGHFLGHSRTPYFSLPPSPFCFVLPLPNHLFPGPFPPFLGVGKGFGRFRPLPLLSIELPKHADRAQNREDVGGCYWRIWVG